MLAFELPLFGIDSRLFTCTVSIVIKYPRIVIASEHLHQNRFLKSVTVSGSEKKLARYIPQHYLLCDQPTHRLYLSSVVC